MVALYPSWINIAMAACYGFILMVRWWNQQRYPWGVIYDAEHQPVAGAIISLVNRHQPQLRRPPVVTKSSGRYAFLVDRGEYVVQVVRQHQGVISPSMTTATIKQKRAKGYIAEDINLLD
jgi:hypothetical protein